MGTANIGIVGRLYAAFAERNIPGIVETLTPDVEWCEPRNPYNPMGVPGIVRYVCCR